MDVLQGSILSAAASHKPVSLRQHQHKQNSGMKKETLSTWSVCALYLYTGYMCFSIRRPARRGQRRQTGPYMTGIMIEEGQDCPQLRTQVCCYLVLLAFCSPLPHTDCVVWSLSILSHYTKIRSIGSCERHALSHTR